MIGDLDWFGRSVARALVQEIVRRLEADPLTESRNSKILRPNPVAERELRLMGRYRALYTVDRKRRRVAVVLVGEKTGNALAVRGERFTAHESDPAE